jgi:exopolysaccharide biosynthesis polyprenyl glycosylphosphotransferase
VSSPFLYPGPQKSTGTAWANRLIPGAASVTGRKKPQRELRSPFSSATTLPDPELKTVSSLASLTCSHPIQRRGGKIWFRSYIRHYSVVIIGWLVTAELCLQLHKALPQIAALSALAQTSSISPLLVGFVLLHGLAIKLSSHPEGRYVDDADRRKQMWRIGKATLQGTLLSGAALHLQGFSALAVVPLYGAGLLYFSFWLAWQWAERKADVEGIRAICGMRNVLIVGAGPLGRNIANYLDQHSEMDRAICGFLDDTRLSEKDVLGPTSNLAELARTGFIDEVILVAPRDRELTLRVLRQAQQLRLDVKLVPDLFGCYPPPEVEQVGGIPLISLHEEAIPVRRLLLKRVVDIVSAAAALILWAPVLAFLAMLIKVDSPGPVFYAAPRAGRKGRPFRCYKFRTMVKDADILKQRLREQNQRQGPFFKITDDPRVTRVGRLLRRYSLDELPQLLNVLKGEMSLVGPRPHPMDDFSAYTIEHLSRLDVLPGMTGLWQVTARRDPSFHAGMNLDLEYIQRWSLAMDLRILWKTAGVVLRGSGE